MTALEARLLLRFPLIGAETVARGRQSSIESIAVRMSFEQHRIAIAKKAVPPGDCVSIRSANRLYARKCRNEHQQCRFRQMKIGEQAIDDTEAESGRDEQARLAGERPYMAIGVGGRFQRSQRRRADYQNPSAASPCRSDG